jgi:LPS sulfotransferase NodH
MEDWAKQTLNAEELSQCLSSIEDNNNLWKSYHDQGLYTTHQKYEQVYIAELESTVNVLVGEEIVLSPGTSLHGLAQDPEYINWANRFKSETGFYDSGLVQID